MTKFPTLILKTSTRENRKAHLYWCITFYTSPPPYIQGNSYRFPPSQYCLVPKTCKGYSSQPVNKRVASALGIIPPINVSSGIGLHTALKPHCKFQGSFSLPWFRFYESYVSVLFKFMCPSRYNRLSLAIHLVPYSGITDFTHDCSIFTIISHLFVANLLMSWYNPYP